MTPAAQRINEAWERSFHAGNLATDGPRLMEAFLKDWSAVLSEHAAEIAALTAERDRYKGLHEGAAADANGYAAQQIPIVEAVRTLTAERDALRAALKVPVAGTLHATYPEQVELKETPHE